MEINLGVFRQELVIKSYQYLNETGKLFLFQSDKILNGNVVTASQAETGYVILPLLSSFTNIDVNRLINFLFFGLILITLLICLFSSIRLSKNKQSKLFSIIFFILAIFFSYNLYLTEYAEYSFYYYFGLLAIYPIYLSSKKNIKSLNFFFIICIFSIIFTLFGLFRGYIYINLILIFLFLIFFKLKSKNIFKLLCIFVLISPIYITQVISKNVSDTMNKNYYELVEADPANKYYKNYKGEILLGHNLWHTLYASLNFLNNNTVKGHNSLEDDVIRDLLNRDVSSDWHFYISDNELIKNEIRNILFQNPTLIFKIFFAKLGIIFGYVLLISNIGLHLFINRKFVNENKFTIICLLINLIILSIFPLVAIPSKVYLGGVFSSCMLIFYCYILNIVNKSKL